MDIIRKTPSTYRIGCKLRQKGHGPTHWNFKLVTEFVDSDQDTEGCSLRHITVGERALWCASQIVFAAISLFLRILPHTVDERREMGGVATFDVKVDTVW